MMQTFVDDGWYITILSNTFFVSFSPDKTFLTLFVSFILWFSILWWCFEFFHGNLFQVEKRWNVPNHTCKDVLHGNMQPLSTRYSRSYMSFDFFCDHVMSQCGVTTFMSRNVTSSYFIACSTCFVSSCHVKSSVMLCHVNVMLPYSMSRHVTSSHFMSCYTCTY